MLKNFNFSRNMIFYSLLCMHVIVMLVSQNAKKEKESSVTKKGMTMKSCVERAKDMLVEACF